MIKIKLPETPFLSLSSLELWSTSLGICCVLFAATMPGDGTFTSEPRSAHPEINNVINRRTKTLFLNIKYPKFLKSTRCNCSVVNIKRKISLFK